jgi:hypothetical protein
MGGYAGWLLAESTVDSYAEAVAKAFASQHEFSWYKVVVVSGKPSGARSVRNGNRRRLTMAEDADREHQKLLWDAALESMGRDTVRVRLNHMPADRSAPFKLPGQPSCKRGYAEDWLGRCEAKGKVLEARRHRDVFWITVITVAVGLVAAVAAVATAWPVVLDWIN